MSSNEHQLPTFLVIGAGKSGTTSVHQYLRQNPSVSLPKRKETHFFVLDQDGEQAPQLFFGKEHENPVYNLEEYLADFEKPGPGKIMGEVCPSYLFYPNTAKNIRARIPDARLICILRNPIDRFYSNFNFLSSKEQQKQGFRMQTSSEDFDTLTLNLNQPNSVEIDRLLEIGKYSVGLKRYYDVFPKSQIKVFLFDDLLKTPVKLMNELAEFAGIPPFEYDVSMKFNRSGNLRFFWFYKTFRGSQFAKTMQSLLPPLLYQRIRVVSERLAFSNANPMSKKSQARLQQYYRDEINELEKLIDRDLSDWKLG